LKRIILILSVGLVFGLLDIIPLIPVGAPLFNMIAIATFWIVAAIIMSKTRFIKNNILDGLVMAVLLMLPLILTVSAVNPKDFVPMLAMAVILGPLCSLVMAKLKLRA
jgi:hypothetical protein